METLTPTASVNFHPSRLTTDEIYRCMDHAKELKRHAPRLCNWLIEFMATEQIRRLKLLDGEYIEPMLPRFPFEWPNKDFAEALNLCNILTDSVESYELGRFFDALNDTINSMAAHRLRNLEQWLP